MGGGELILFSHRNPTTGGDRVRVNVVRYQWGQGFGLGWITARKIVNHCNEENL